MCVCILQTAMDASAPPLQDAATEGTMSSEDLPLIFEPFDVTPEGAGIAAATLSPDNSQPSVTMVTTGMLLSEADLDQVVTVDTDDTGPSRVPSPVLPDWTSPWQTSGAEISETICPSGTPIDPPPSETEQPGETSFLLIFLFIIPFVLFIFSQYCLHSSDPFRSRSFYSGI